MPEETLANDNTGADKAEEAAVEKTTEETTEQNATEATEKTQETEKETALTEYADFNIPEDFVMNTEVLEMFKPFALESGLNQEQAQKAVDIYSQAKLKDYEAEVVFRQKAYGDVVKELTADKSIGKEGIGNINAMLTKYGGKDAKDFLDIAVLGASGLSKDAAKGFMTALHAIAKAAGDHEIVNGQTQTKNIAEKYPGLPQNK